MKYEFNNWEKEDFLIFLNSIDLNTMELNFILSDNLVKNLNIFFDFFKNKNIKLNLIKTDLDIIMLRKLKKYFDENFNSIQNINFKLIDFNSYEIKSILDDWKYFYYCNKNNLVPEIDFKNEKFEIEKVEKYKSNFFKYDSFKLCYDFFQNNKNQCYFNFPKEEGTNRFVFYFYLYDESIKEKIINLFKKIGINNNIIENLKKIKLFSHSILFAIGFSYIDKSLIRTSFYNRFFELNSKYNLNYIEQYDKFQKYALLNIVDFAIDYYDNHKEYKFYFKENLFDLKLENKELNSIFNKSGCIKVLKILKNNHLIYKYEFGFNSFNDLEIEILKKNNLYQSNHKLLAIYISENKIIKNIFYDI